MVFSAHYEDQQVYVKGRHFDFLAHPEELLHWQDHNRNEVFPSKSDFEAMTRAYLWNNMGLKLEENIDVMDQLWPPASSSKPVDTSIENWQMSNLWHLIQDNEYVLTKIYSKLDVFPTLVGTCGSIYVVEELEPLALPGYFDSLKFSDWAKRVSVALATLDLLDEFESILDHPVHLCDVKPDHFGISDVGRIKFLDLDSVYLKPMLDRMMTQNVSCTKHSECDFFDCRGQCDLIEGICINGVVNNNLQVVCEKVFKSRGYGLPVDFPGLLTAKHLNKKLKALLARCANPTGSKDGVRIATEPQVRTELYKALREILDMARQVEHEERQIQHRDI